MPRDTIVEPVMAAELEALASPPGPDEQAAAARRRGTTAATRRGEMVMVRALIATAVPRLGDAWTHVRRVSTTQDPRAARGGQQRLFRAMRRR
jgi:hypothetical protein